MKILGRPVAYTTTDNNLKNLNTLLEIFRYNDESAHNSDLAEEASITGEAFEILYMDSDAKFENPVVEDVQLATGQERHPPAT